MAVESIPLQLSTSITPQSRRRLSRRIERPHLLGRRSVQELRQPGDDLPVISAVIEGAEKALGAWRRLIRLPGWNCCGHDTPETCCVRQHAAWQDCPPSINDFA